MALKGSLEIFGLADILQLIHFQRKSGILTLEGGKDKVRLFFIEGNIVGAISKRRQEDARIGKVLVKKGSLKDEDLQKALEEQRSTGKSLGSILLKQGVVEKEHIKEVVTSQVTETVLQLFSWEKGIYDFTPQAITLDSVGDREIPVTLDTQHLLMEGLRILDDWSLLEGRLTLDTVFKRRTEAVTELSKEEQEILLLVDGENDLSTIIDISGKDGFTAAKILFSLMEKGVVERQEAAPVIEEPIKEVKKAKLPDSSLYPIALAVAIAISVVISVSMGLVVSGDTIKEFRASKTVESLRLKIEAYRFEHGEYPAAIGTISNQVDPWERHYIYKPSMDTFIIMSAGADGKEGTADDIF